MRKLLKPSGPLNSLSSLQSISLHSLTVRYLARCSQPQLEQVWAKRNSSLAQCVCNWLPLCFQVLPQLSQRCLCSPLPTSSVGLQGIRNAGDSITIVSIILALSCFRVCLLHYSNEGVSIGSMGESYFGDTLKRPNRPRTADSLFPSPFQAALIKSFANS